jgi:hypothetical protein
MPRREEIPFEPSTLETIDQAMFDWVKKLKIHTTTNKGWDEVPLIWVSAERAYQIKHEKELRDSDGSLILPLMTIERSALTKDFNRKGPWWGNVPPVNDAKGGSVWVKNIVNHEKTSNFANADAKKKEGQINFPRKNNKVVYKQVYIPMPVYVELSYTLNLRTEYQQQINEIVTPFVTKPGGINHFLMKADGHKYEGFIESIFSLENNVGSMSEQERKYQSRVVIKVLGYLIGEGNNQESPKIVIRENAVEVKFPRERVIFGDIPEGIGDEGFYRE